MKNKRLIIFAFAAAIATPCFVVGRPDAEVLKEFRETIATVRERKYMEYGDYTKLMELIGELEADPLSDYLGCLARLQLAELERELRNR
ncbi:TPA: hypothetical protein DEO28_02890 [Candidatus Dependentiae bacterium]|nr:MAG: hypothetical protein UR14_C0005G0071 [candidate division TM6 bacterium GW2011_GWE2_31_21]KKP53147.1 MAG: hypothetical protein UR43_C0007G0071 [candidate division TM6 bacterium GW2011_GWF2_33_332]HBS47966.1 hypothetical protein [Candidatus Dependentiae bacterium]HBZ73430.1 hypothetical protein [Candidatus Dependentiae bacterium]